MCSKPVHHLTRLCAKLVGNVRQNPTQNLVAAPSVKTSMHSFVVQIALRQHVPLRTRKNVVDRKSEQQSERKRHENHGDCGLPELRRASARKAVSLIVKQTNILPIFLAAIQSVQNLADWFACGSAPRSATPPAH